MGLKDQDLYLDPSIRDWVLIPITLIMLLVGVLRHYVTQLLNSPPKKQPRAHVREQRLLTRSHVIRASAPLSPLYPEQYKAFSSSTSAALTSGDYIKAKPEKDKDAPTGPFDPSQMDTMMDGMKKQAVMMVPNMLIMQYINVFFSGYILIKLPFPLTLGAKSLFARDLTMPDLSVRWVSALSWYFLNLFGLNGVFRLILGNDNAAVETRDMSGLAGLAGAGAGPVMTPTGPQDMSKVFEAEAENLALSDGQYRWVGSGIEDRVLQRWGK